MPPDSQTTNPARPEAPRKRESMLLNLGCNILLPILLLTKGSDWFGWSAALNLTISLAFPLGYGIYDFVVRRKLNFFSAVGFTSVLLTGGIGLMALPSSWIAIKEAAIPLVFGIAVLLSLKTRRPLVRLFLMNPEVIDVDRIQSRLREADREREFDGLLRSSTWLVAASFFLSTVLNYVLARIVVRSPSGTEAFNVELARMQGLSFIVILVPCMAVLGLAMVRLFRGIRRLTGLDWEELMVQSNPPQRDKTG